MRGKIAFDGYDAAEHIGIGTDRHPPQQFAKSSDSKLMSPVPLVSEAKRASLPIPLFRPTASLVFHLARRSGMIFFAAASDGMMLNQ
jgi:hypothetical protein